MSHEVEITTMELAGKNYGKMLEKLQESKDASSVPLGRKMCVLNDTFGGMVRGRSLGVGKRKIEFG